MREQTDDEGRNTAERQKTDHMRKKELRVVVSFQTTTQALAMEEAGKAGGLKGRLIPIPQQITADCGLAWSEPADGRRALEQILRENHLSYDRLTELVI